MNGFDWPALMRLGLYGLRLTPAQFWALTPAELHVMAGRGMRSPVMGRDGLEKLLAAFPDDLDTQDTGVMSDGGP
ncbi:MAG: rcc01693 family protein [Pseudomonadota bacterium]|nr:rcc01693 family protein [Pseudomonadota bacterium]